MRRSGVLLAAVVLLSGCRHCGDRPGLFDRFRSDRRDDCDTAVKSPPDCDPRLVGATKAKAGAPGSLTFGTPMYLDSGFTLGPAMPVYPGGPATVVPPVTGSGGPANELPMPSIPPTNLPYAQPSPTMSAIPNAANARTTGDTKAGK